MHRAIYVALGIIVLLGLLPLAWITFDLPPPAEWFAAARTARVPVRMKTAAGAVAEEVEARSASGREFLRSALELSRTGAYSDARDLIRRGFRMDPDSEDLVDAFEEIRGRSDETRPPAHLIKEWRDRAFRRSWSALVALYRHFTEEGLEAERERIAQLFMEVLPVGPVKSELSLVWFEPYSRWMLPDQVKKLRLGSELIDGEWIPPDEMARKNEAHRTWLNPWVLSDGVHVVHAPVDYRVAKEILEYTAAFRRFFLSTYRDDLWLEKPEVPLPIWIGRNQGEYEDRIRLWFLKRFPGQDMEHQIRRYAKTRAVYLLLDDTIGSPVVIPLMSEDERTAAWEFWPVLRHELTHQLVATHLFHERPTRSRGWHRGLSESIAEHTEHYNLDESGWRFNRYEFARTLRRCRDDLPHDPSLTDVVERDILRLRWPTNHEAGIRRMLACLAAFCLLGDDPDHRLAYLSLLETSEMHRLSRERFRECLTYRHAGGGLRGGRRNWFGRPACNRGRRERRLRTQKRQCAKAQRRNRLGYGTAWRFAPAPAKARKRRTTRGSPGAVSSCPSCGPCDPFTAE